MEDTKYPTVDERIAELNEQMKDFSHVEYAKEKGDPEIDLNFGKLTKEQSLKVRQFWDEHNKLHGSYAGAIGGRYEWRVIFTSIGEIVITKCGACKQELDVTDYEGW